MSDESSNLGDIEELSRLYVEKGQFNTLRKIQQLLKEKRWEQEQIEALENTLALAREYRQQSEKDQAVREAFERVGKQPVQINNQNINQNQNASDGSQQANQNAGGHPSGPGMSTEAKAAWAFGLLALILLSVVLFAFPDRSNNPIVRLFSGLLAGAFGFFASGSLVTKAEINLGTAGKLFAKGTAGFGLFALVFFGISAIPGPAPLPAPGPGPAPTPIQQTQPVSAPADPIKEEPASQPTAKTEPTPAPQPTQPQLTQVFQIKVPAGPLPGQKSRATENFAIKPPSGTKLLVWKVEHPGGNNVIFKIMKDVGYSMSNPLKVARDEDILTGITDGSVTAVIDRGDLYIGGIQGATAEFTVTIFAKP